MEIFEYILNGALFGSTYSLVAIGFTLIFGVIHRLNVAHGATIMVAGYAGATVSILLGGDSYAVMVLAIGAAILAGAAVAALVQLVAFRPLKDASYMTPFVTTIGVTIILEELFLHISRRVPFFYPEYSPFPSVMEDAVIPLGDIIVVRGLYVVIFVIALVLMIALHLWITRTRVGRAIRTIEENAEIAHLMGVDVRRVEMLVFVVSGALAGAAGALIGMATGSVNPFMGANLLLVGFVVIVLGGLGNMYGAMVGGIVVGILESLTVGLLSATWKQALLFALLFLVLLARPEGLFAKAGVKRD